MKLSIQFTGWVQAKVVDIKNNDKLNDSIKKVFTNLWWEEISSNTTKEWSNNVTTILLQTKSQDQQVSELTQLLNKALTDGQHIVSNNQIVQVSTVWPSIGDYMSKTAVQAIVRGLIFMIIYMIFAFRAIRTHIQPLVLATIVIITMLFDVLSPMWVYGIRSMFDATAQVDVIFIVALLTTMWYSINDTIIIFDRIRENLAKATTKVNMAEIFDDSLRQTMRRSLWTSFATLLVVIAMYIFWTGDLWRFAFTMIFWVLSGSFSSIFMAAPVAYLIMKGRGDTK